MNIQITVPMLLELYCSLLCIHNCKLKTMAPPHLTHSICLMKAVGIMGGGESSRRTDVYCIFVPHNKLFWAQLCLS